MDHIIVHKFTKNKRSNPQMLGQCEFTLKSNSCWAYLMLRDN